MRDKSTKLTAAYLYPNDEVSNRGSLKSSGVFCADGLVDRNRADGYPLRDIKITFWRQDILCTPFSTRENT